MKKKRTIPSLAGGIEREYGILYPELYNLTEGESLGLNFFRGFTSSLNKEIEALGGSIEHLDYMDGIIKELLADGGCIGREEMNVFEASTPECLDALAAVTSLQGYESLFKRALQRINDIPPRLLVTGGPSYIPSFAPRRTPDFRLGFHMNFSAKLGRGLANELSTILVALLPFIGCGGLSEKGFCISPAGRVVKNTFILNENLWGHENLMEQNISPVVTGPSYGDWFFEHRLHFPAFDCPLTNRTTAFIFSALQLLLVLLLYRESPMSGNMLLSPVRAYRAIANSDFDRRFRLDGGSLTTIFELQDSIRHGLERVRSEFALSPLQESTVDYLLQGIAAFRDGDEAWLSEKSDGYLKKWIYVRILSNEGLTLAFFNNVLSPAVYHASKLCQGLHELALLEGKEIKNLLAIKKTGARHRKALVSLLEENHVPASDIPIYAKLMQRMITLELKLCEIFPDPSPLAEYDMCTWADHRRRFDGVSIAPISNRASKRGELIKLLTDKLGDQCRADWSGIYLFPDPYTAGIISFPSPYSPEAVFSWVDSDILDELPYGNYELGFYIYSNHHLIFLVDEAGKVIAEDISGAKSQPIKTLEFLLASNSVNIL